MASTTSTDISNMVPEALVRRREVEHFRTVIDTQRLAHWEALLQVLAVALVVVVLGGGYHSHVTSRCHEHITRTLQDVQTNVTAHVDGGRASNARYEFRISVVLGSLYLSLAWWWMSHLNASQAQERIEARLNELVAGQQRILVLLDQFMNQETDDVELACTD